MNAPNPRAELIRFVTMETNEPSHMRRPTHGVRLSGGSNRNESRRHEEMEHFTPNGVRFRTGTATTLSLLRHYRATSERRVKSVFVIGIMA